MALAVRSQLAADELLAALEGVTAIPVVPYRNGQIDYDAHARNVRYLMRANTLDANRPRVIAIAGTSPVHHIGQEEQVKLARVTTRVMGDEGVYMAGVVPNPLASTRRLIAQLAALPRPPDAYLIMPLGGVYDSRGMYDEFRAFAAEMAHAHGARFLYYFKNGRDLPQVVRLLQDSPHFVGVKVGTGEEDVQPLVEGVGDRGLVIWGIGDRSTRAAERGARGHTSGIAVVYARASDAINNAQRAGDYRTARQIEAQIGALEAIRFRDGRLYNYSAVVEAMHLSGFDDIDGGEGAPFNPRVPAEISREVAEAIAGLAEWH